MSRRPALRYRSEPLTETELTRFAPGDHVDYHIDRSSVAGSTMSIAAVVVSVTDRRIIVRLHNDEIRYVKPDNLTKLERSAE